MGAATRRSRTMTLGELEWQACGTESVDTAYQTDEVDTWGKCVFYIVFPSGDLERVYLFPHEFTFTPVTG